MYRTGVTGKFTTGE